MADTSQDSPYLPPELVTEIYKLSPKATVISCSLVCRQWRHVSMPYRFHSIAVCCRPTKPADDAGPQRDEVVDDEEEEEGGSQVGGGSLKKPLSHFLRFLQHSPHIAEKIHNLTISVHPARFEDSPALSDADYHSFVNILRSLPPLRTLTLNDVLLPKWRGFEVPTDVKLQRLIICYPRHNETVGFRRLLCILQLFAGVDDLCFEHVQFSEPTTTTSFPLQLNVSSLALGKTSTYTSLLESIQHSQRLDPSHATLTRFDFRYMYRSSAVVLNSFLGLIGPQLLHLGCSLPSIVFDSGK